MRTFLIDTDTASDDAVALIMALRHPNVRVAGITVVAGNVPLEQATRNAIYTAELCGRTDVPIYAGASKPLRRECEHATWFHGEDGLGNQHYPPPRGRCRDTHAAEAIVEIVRANPGLTLVTLGPLTNIAMALERDPAIAESIARCVVMGGAPCCEGNVTPAAEYNIWVDPEAARAVLHSGMPVIELVGWQLCRGDANLREDDIAHVRALNTELAHFAIDCNTVAMEANRMQSGEIGIALPDPVAMAVALDPGVCTKRSTHYVDVETQSDLTRGMTVVDRLNVVDDPRNRGAWNSFAGRPKNVSVCWEIDVPLWKEMLFRSLA
jgi:purine nucleosidase